MCYNSHANAFSSFLHGLNFSIFTLLRQIVLFISANLRSFMGGQGVALHKVVILLLLPKASLPKTFAFVFSLMDSIDHLHVIL